jgi:hypothetical protein
MKRIFRMLGLIAFLSAFTLVAHAQTTSTLSGTVRDKSGAVVPGASITVKNQASGDERKTVAGHDGDFAVPGLRAGTYRLSATAKGFGVYEVTDIELHSNDTQSINIELPLKSASESVVVSAKVDSSIMAEDSGAKAETISGDDLQQMTMNSRNAAEVVKLMSGATQTANGGVNRAATTTAIGMNSFMVGGTAAGLGGTLVNGQSVDLTMDGSHDFDPGSAGANTPVNPNMDMISELTVLSSSFSAEYEHGPVVVNVETKGGGEKYHGQLHLYAQNTVMNAVDTTVTAEKATVPNSYQYYPGAQLSGPLPRIGNYNRQHNKLFFFDGFESYRQLLAPGVADALVPSTAMKNGDFSIANNQGLGIYNNLTPNNTTSTTNIPVVATNAPWLPYRPGCVISAAGVMNSACIDATGQKLMNAYFASAPANTDPTTVQGGWNFVTLVTQHLNQWQNVARVDWSISDNTKFYVRVNTSKEAANNPMGVWNSSTGNQVIPAPTTDDAANSATDIAGSLTKIFSPTLTSETSVAWTVTQMPNAPADPSKVDRTALGLPQTVFGEELMPSITNYWSSAPGMGPGGWYNSKEKPYGMVAHKLTPSAKETVTKVIGAHTLKAGGYYEFISNKQDSYGGFGGSVWLGGNWGGSTGNTYADLLLGMNINGYSENQRPPLIGNKETQARFFVTDHWKTTRRLTMDFGVRFDHMGAPYTSGKIGVATWEEQMYDNDPAALNQHTGIQWHSMNPTLPLGGVKSRMFFYSPRFGLSYDLSGKGTTILRGGFGTFYAYNGINGTDNDNAYVNAEAEAEGAGSINCPQSNCPVWELTTVTNPYTGQPNPGIAPYANHPLPAGIPSGLQGVNVIDPKVTQNPYVTTYNLQIDQMLPWKVMVEASYVGNYGNDNILTEDINAIPAGTISETDYLACTNYSGGSNCNYDSGGSAGAPSTNPRPRKNYEGITDTHIAYPTQYDGLQLSAHRSSGILFLLTNFAWAKSYSVNTIAASLPDIGNNEYWGVSSNNRKFTFNATYTLTEPKFNLSHAMDRIANGWQISGITQWTSGPNLNSNAGNNYSYGWNADTHYNTSGAQITDATHDAINQIGADSATLFPTMVCNPAIHKNNVKISSGGTTETGVQFLNQACFTPTVQGLGSTHTAYWPGPAYTDSDLGIMKTVKINERQNIQLKAQAFNFFNHPLWSFNGSDYNLQTGFNGLTYNQSGALATTEGSWNKSAFFGLATLRTGHRSVQLEARYWF